MAPPAPTYAGFDALPPAPERGFAIIGDTQRTSRLEFIWPAHDAEQEALFHHLTADPPDLLMNVGDLVTWGPSRGCWRRFDRLHAGLRESDVAVFPAIGNHDLMPWSGGGLEQIDRRFPFLAGRRWYTVRYGALALVVLDSNFKKLGKQRVAAQQRWFEETLAALDGDPTVRGVFALWHHPPWTNSRVVRPSGEAERRLVPELLRAPKVLALFCGHCHAYEHFREGRLHAFVTGGGGGPLQPLRVNAPRSKDLFRWEGDKRFLHYLRGRVSERAVIVECVRVSSTGEIGIVDSVTMDLPGPGSTSRG